MNIGESAPIMPPLQLVLMLQRMMKEKEEAFWHGLDVAMGEELELGPAPLTIQLEEVGQQVAWWPAVELAQEGPPLSPLGPVPMEVDGAKQVPKDGAMAEDAAGEQVNSSPS